MKIQLSQKSPAKKIAATVALVSLLCYAAFTISSPASKQVAFAQLNFATVQQGDFDIYASSFGEFASAKERLLTAPALGKVAQIMVRPGAQVTKDTVILRLNNPKLEQEVNQAKGKLAQNKAKHEAFKYEQQNDRLSYQGTIASIEADLEKAQLDLTVNLELKDLGAVSKLDLLKAQLSVRQQTKRLNFETQKYQQFLQMQSYQLTQSNITVEQQDSQVKLLEQQLQSMQVKAGIEGTLQTLEVELGQSVQLGHSLAKVGSDKELIAHIRLPQRQADQIDLNAKVIINTQKGLIDGHISRIETLVTNGSVLAEVAIDGPLTSNARPALPISAQVFVKHQKNALYIEQVAGLRPRTTQSVFVRDAKNSLQRINITLGDLSQDKLMVVDGLAVDQQIVSNNTSQYANFNQLVISY
ncbi:MAG: HlyD family efflux transporter periplasmic adaptor subunit [Algicola sp.]|nr:HlyD family efflux transporter periplasmic adaptor subunit [Algicola sp.]